MRATLKFYEKYCFGDRYIIEMALYEVNDKKRYIKGVKYRLICIDTKNGNKVLMDNHHPKGDHFHLNEKEMLYNFSTPEQLITDFKKIVFEHLGVKL